MAINKRIIKSNDGGAAVPTSFNTVLYTGDGTLFVDDPHPITGVGFQPDFTWIKSRTSTLNHTTCDSVRGAGKVLYPNLTNGEVTAATPIFIDSFDSDGFTVNALHGGNTNENGVDFVAWCWRAGGAAVTNTDGTITSQVSANTEAGFSIVSYTGNGANGTVGHGLGTTPNIVLTKRRNSTSNWSFNGNFGGLIYGTNKLTLNTLSAIGADTNEVLAANSSTFTAGTSGAVGASGGTYVAYCFAEVLGFSKFGSYTGNLSSQTDIDCGFEPAFVMIKCTSGFNSGDWVFYDNKRPTGNPKINPLLIRPFAEQNALLFGINFTENGFNIPTTCTTNSVNQTGYTYMYMAFANQF